MTRRAAALVLLLAWPCLAADRGTVLLRVVDPEGRPVAGAEVQLTLKNTWRKLSRVVDADGRARFFALPVEPFRLHVNAAGFDPEVDSRDCLEVLVGRRIRLTVVLRAVGERRARERECPVPEPEAGSSLVL